METTPVDELSIAGRLRYDAQILMVKYPADGFLFALAQRLDAAADGFDDLTVEIERLRAAEELLNQIRAARSWHDRDIDFADRATEILHGAT